MRAKNILLTGPPRCGKSTLVEKLIRQLDRPLTGFFTTPSRPDQIVVIDEIGKMECISPLFRETLPKVLDSENLVIASVAQKGNAFIEKIKEREDVLLVIVSEKNRDSLLPFLLEQIPATGDPVSSPVA